MATGRLAYSGFRKVPASTFRLSKEAWLRAQTKSVCRVKALGDRLQCYMNVNRTWQISQTGPIRSTISVDPHDFHITFFSVLFIFPVFL